MSWATHGIAALIVVSSTVLNAMHASADVVASFDPLAQGLISDAPLEARWVQYGATASPLTVVNMGPTAYVNDFAFPVGVTTTSPDIDLESYVTFTVAGNVTYESIQYDARSYGSGPFTTAIRSDVDSFGANLDLVTELPVNSFDAPEGFHRYTFDVSSLGAHDGPVEFRIYHWDSLDEFGEGGGFQDIASSWNEGASGLTVRGIVDAPPTPEGIIANFNPTGPNDSLFPLPPAIEADGLDVSELTNVGFEGGSWNNPNSAYPVGPTSLSSTIDLDRFISFTVDGNATYEAVQFDAISYGSGPDKSAIRSSADNFAANLDLVGGLPISSNDEPEGLHSYIFDVSSLGAHDGPVEFRIYHWDSLDAFDEGGGFQDIASTLRGGTGLTVFGESDSEWSLLQAGDADQDLDFDQFDLVLVQQGARYLTNEPATWGQGDWNGAPGGQPGSPPTGDGLFNQFDIIAALAPGHYLAGPYAAGVDPVVTVALNTVLVPEPTGFVLLSLGILSMSWMSRRRVRLL